MTTSEFIKMLQDADPKGTAHIRMEGGIPYVAELKAGYWDGPYSYLDGDGNFVYSSAGNKVDIHCMDIWTFVERCMNKHTKWEEIESKFKFKLGDYCIKDHANERAQSILKEAKKSFDELRGIDNEIYEKSLQDNIKHANDGWTWFQNKDVDLEQKPNMYTYYSWKIFDSENKEQGSNISLTESVMNSGLWAKKDNNKKIGYYQWVFMGK